MLQEAGEWDLGKMFPEDAQRSYGPKVTKAWEEYQKGVESGKYISEADYKEKIRLENEKSNKKRSANVTGEDLTYDEALNIEMPSAEEFQGVKTPSVYADGKFVKDRVVRDTDSDGRIIPNRTVASVTPTPVETLISDIGNNALNEASKATNEWGGLY